MLEAPAELTAWKQWSQKERNAFAVKTIALKYIHHYQAVLDSHSLRGLNRMPNQWPEIIKIALGGFVALSVSLYVAPGLISAAERYGIVDHPNNPLKQQKKPVAYLGGLVIFIGFVLGLAVTTQFDQSVLGLLLATSLVVSVGLIDDLGTLIPRDKFLWSNLGRPYSR